MKTESGQLPVDEMDRRDEALLNEFVKDCPSGGPAFPSQKERNPVTFTWWSWHPLYPYWSKSCWDAPTIQAAEAILERPEVGLDIYHNKLIMDDNGVLSEVRDVPCKKPEVWERIWVQSEIKQKMRAKGLNPERYPQMVRAAPQKLKQ